MKNYSAIFKTHKHLLYFACESKKIILASICLLFLQGAFAQENSADTEIARGKNQIQQIESEKLVSKILVIENQIKIELETQNKKFTSVSTFYSGLELEKIQSKLPHFATEGYKILNKDLVVFLSKTYPEETRMYLDILISVLTKINKK